MLLSSALGSFLAIVILLIKKIFKNKLSASWHYYIWLLLLLRLAIPYSYQSPLSIFNIFTKPLNNVGMSLNTPSVENSTVAQNNVNEGTIILPDNNYTSTNKPMAVSGQNAKNTKTIKFDLFSIVSIIWLIVMLGSLLFIIIFNTIFNNRSKYQEICKDKETLDILKFCKGVINVKGYIPVAYASNLNGVALYGIFKPQILISDMITNNFTVEQKRYIFLHELIHLKYKDILINWIMLILVVFNWFNPIIWYSYYRMQQDCELACDEKVLYYLQPTNYGDYSSTIINMAALFSKSHNIFNSTALVSDKSNLKRRIGMINSFKGKSLKWSMIGLVIIALIGLACLMNPKVAASPYNKTTATDSIILNTNNSSQTGNKEDYLKFLNIILPQNWNVDKSQQLSYGIKDEKGENRGYIGTMDYVDNFDFLKQMPNHSSVAKDEYIDIPFGKCRLITLDADNGSAASGLTGTHYAYYAAIPVKGNAIYVLNFTKNDKKAETKSQFIGILKNLSINSKSTEQGNNNIVIPGDAKIYISSKVISEQNLFITEAIKNIYENYSKSKSDELLKGLNPIDILRLYNEAGKNNNFEMQVALTELPIGVTKEQFTQEIKNDNVGQEIEKKLLQRFYEFKGKIIERVVDDKKAYIIIEENGWYRMEKDKNGVWKLGWMARA